MGLQTVSFHHVFVYTLFFFFSMLAVVATNATGSIHAHSDQEALLAFKEKVDDPLGSLMSWNSSVPLCQWHGVTCGYRHRTRVIQLQLRHQSLTGADYSGNEFKALIYEFMVNGNLDGWLHQNPQENRNISKRLSFSQRLNVAIDIANVLDYLHNGCENSIVHCDLKPSNILLDNEFVAHVGDFGLAICLPSETKSSSVKGSIGYTAPEYGMGSKPSTLGDVYSFGMLLLEIFTGRRPTNDMFRDLTDLHCHVKNALPDEVIEVVDPCLLEDWEPHYRRVNIQENVRFSKEAQKQIEGLISIFKLGVACSSYAIADRENMKDVVQKLCSIRDVYTS